MEESLKALSIPFFIEEGDPEQMLPAFVERHKISHLVTDFSPMRLGRQWRDTVTNTNHTIYLSVIGSHYGSSRSGLGSQLQHRSMRSTLIT